MKNRVLKKIIVALIPITSISLSHAAIPGTPQMIKTRANVTLSPVNVSISTMHQNWVQTISICNSTDTAIPLDNIEIDFNYNSSMPTNIWGNPWSAWNLESQSGNAVVLKGGTPYTPALLPDPNCTDPLTIQFNASPNTSQPTGPFVFKADTGEAPVTTGTLTINMPASPAANLANPSVIVTGNSFSKERTLQWGQSWEISQVNPGDYTIKATATDNGSQFYEATDITSSVTAQQNTEKTITYTAVTMGNVNISLTDAPNTTESVTFSGNKYTFTKTVGNETISLPKDTYNITTEEPNYSITYSPNPLNIPTDTALNIKYSQASACNYDVSKDKLTFVKEYETTAISGWYTDTFSTPVTTVNNIVYYVYVNPSLRIKVGTIKNGVVNEYSVNDSYKVSDDGHNEFSIAVDKDGYVHLAGNMHNNELRYWRSDNPYDVSKFTKHFGDIEGTGFSYNYFRKDNNGELYLVARAVLLNKYWANGGRGVGLYHFDRNLKYWIAKGEIPDYTNGTNKGIAWENSGKSGTSYQRYKTDLRFDKSNLIHFTTPINNDNSSNSFNYVLYGYSDDAGSSFKHAAGGTITPLPMRADSGSSQADIIAGYQDANMGEHSNIFLDRSNNVGIYYTIDNATWYKYVTNGTWSNRVQLSSSNCSRCVTLSDQDNGVMTFINGSKWYRFTKFGQTPTSISGSATIKRWDLAALRNEHVYRGVAWNSSSGSWIIYRVDVNNSTKCY